LLETNADIYENAVKSAVTYEYKSGHLYLLHSIYFTADSAKVVVCLEFLVSKRSESMT